MFTKVKSFFRKLFYRIFHYECVLSEKGKFFATYLENIVLEKDVYIDEYEESIKEILELVPSLDRKQAALRMLISMAKSSPDSCDSEGNRLGDLLEALEIDD